MASCPIVRDPRGSRERESEQDCIWWVSCRAAYLLSGRNLARKTSNKVWTSNGLQKKAKKMTCSALLFLFPSGPAAAAFLRGNPVRWAQGIEGCLVAAILKGSLPFVYSSAALTQGILPCTPFVGGEEKGQGGGNRHRGEGIH
jgi:hypothetical protein